MSKKILPILILGSLLFVFWMVDASVDAKFVSGTPYPVTKTVTVTLEPTTPTAAAQTPTPESTQVLVPTLTPTPPRLYFPVITTCDEHPCWDCEAWPYQEFCENLP